MAQNQRGTVTKKKINNANTYTTVNVDVELVLVNGQLVPDHREIDPGVFSK
jgi:hypothetical protein